MVLFVELEDEGSEPPELRTLQERGWSAKDGMGVERLRLGDDRENPNRNSMSEALGCYPYVYSRNQMFTTLRILLMLVRWGTNIRMIL